MALEAYTEVTGALRTSKFKEVPTVGISKKKGNREQEVGLLSAINADGQLVDANEMSMDRLDRVISLGMAEAQIAADSANTIWDTSTFYWVDANNTVITISLRQAVELQRDALTKLSATWFKYA